jgi:hypothetical protein
MQADIILRFSAGPASSSPGMKTQKALTRQAQPKDLPGAGVVLKAELQQRLLAYGIIERDIIHHLAPTALIEEFAQEGAHRLSRIALPALAMSDLDVEVRQPVLRLQIAVADLPYRATPRI